MCSSMCAAKLIRLQQQQPTTLDSEQASSLNLLRLRDPHLHTLQLDPSSGRLGLWAEGLVPILVGIMLQTHIKPWSSFYMGDMGVQMDA